MKRDGNCYTLTSGRTIYAHRGILGLEPESDSLKHGYDGTVIGPPGCPFTAEERHEIAEEMIGRWNRWAIPIRTQTHAGQSVAYATMYAMEAMEALQGPFQQQIDDARAVIAGWPEWKKNILVQSGSPTVETPRTPIENK